MGKPIQRFPQSQTYYCHAAANVKGKYVHLGLIFARDYYAFKAVFQVILFRLPR
jgi:hypothetical protein